MTSAHCKKHDMSKKKKVIVTAGAIDVILVCPECEREQLQGKFNFDLRIRSQKGILSSAKSGGS